MIAYSIDGTALENPTRWLREDGVDAALAAPAWRGDDLLIPGMVGELPLPRVRAVAYDEFVLSITGDVTSAGAVASDPCAQLLTNIRAAQALLVPSDGGTITVTKTLTTAAGDVVLGPAVARCVSDLAPRFESPTFARFLVRLKVFRGWAANSVTVYEDGTWVPVNWSVGADGFPPFGGIEFNYSETITLFEDGTWSPVDPYDPALHGFPPPVDGSGNQVVVFEDGTWVPVNWLPADGFPPPGGIEFNYSQTITLFEDGSWSPIPPYDVATDGFPPPPDA